MKYATNLDVGQIFFVYLKKAFHSEMQKKIWNTLPNHEIDGLCALQSIDCDCKACVWLDGKIDIIHLILTLASSSVVCCQLACLSYI